MSLWRAPPFLMPIPYCLPILKEPENLQYALGISTEVFAAKALLATKYVDPRNSIEAEDTIDVEGVMGRYGKHKAADHQNE